ncbi:HAD family hydrolase (plasmid) [Halorussus limi]|uniref:HAD family hydrolase n=1 Tax=Halorussus limi TaxID=2938695 RepID=A0A8U0I0S3_9EURY|nr:HAD family hydrolase [Halorussus limi]UPV76797.1 HAD family hydrolase [Halorussus limi]
MAAEVTTVLFDLDETLCEYIRSGVERLAEAFERADVEPYFTYDEYVREVNEVGGTESDIRRRESCFVKLARKKGFDESIGLRVADAYEALTDYTEMQLLPDAEQVLDTLADQYQLGLVTNGGPDTQSPKIDALDIRERFDTIILAGYETAAKPHPEPFQQALSEFDATKEQTVYIGNSLSSDIVGANKYGLQSVWKPHARSLDDVNPTAKPTSSSVEIPDYQIDSLQDLTERPWQSE